MPASMAKLAANETAVRVSNNCLQVFGERRCRGRNEWRIRVTGQRGAGGLRAPSYWSM